MNRGSPLVLFAVASDLSQMRALDEVRGPPRDRAALRHADRRAAPRDFALGLGVRALNLRGLLRSGRAATEGSTEPAGNSSCSDGTSAKQENAHGCRNPEQLLKSMSLHRDSPYKNRARSIV